MHGVRRSLRWNRRRRTRSICGQILEKAIGEAAEKFVETRTREGENLKQDLLGKLDYMVTLVDQIEERSPKIVEEYRAKLEDKVKELLEGSSVDEGRIAAEVVIFADKICTDEETVRLEKPHRGDPQGADVGRKRRT